MGIYHRRVVLIPGRLKRAVCRGVKVIRRLVLAGVLTCGIGAAGAADPLTPQSYGDAMLWYRTEAEKGYARAQFLFGYMHEIGQQAPRDAAIARAWYARAAGQGEPRAQYRLAGTRSAWISPRAVRRPRTRPPSTIRLQAARSVSTATPLARAARMKLVVVR